MNKPDPQKIKEWVKDPVTGWFLERVAFHLNTIDTARNIKLEDAKEVMIARRLAIEIVENGFSDIINQGELEKLQKKLGKEEESVLENLRKMNKNEY